MRNVPDQLRRPVVGAAVLAALFVALFAQSAHAKTPPAGQGTVSGSSVCSGTASSSDDNGKVVGTASGAPGTSAHESKPFVISTSGKVKYSGTITKQFGKGNYTVKVQGVNVKSDTFNNTKKLARSDSFNIKGAIPFAIKGPKIWGSFNVVGAKAKCVGGVWVKFEGSPVGTVPWIISLAIALVGLAGIATSRPKVKP